MARILIILFVGLLLEAVGVVLLSRGLKQVGELQQASFSELARVVRQGVTNRSILAGVFFEALFFVSLLILLARSDVSLIWPLTSLGFIITTLAAKYLAHEQVSSLRWSGVFLIVLGAALVGWSEKRPAQPSPAVAAVSDLSRPRSE